MSYSLKYDLIFPFLKVFHPTLDSWRPNRYREGGKFKDR